VLIDFVWECGDRLTCSVLMSSFEFCDGDEATNETGAEGRGASP
jgi:hypothetical protein